MRSGRNSVNDYHDMTGCPVVPLHVRSGYSLLRGTMDLGSLPKRAREMGHRTLALTDVNNLYGATLFHKLTEREDLNAIIGSELVEADRSVIALVESESGYENLCRLITRINRRDEQDEESEILLSDLAELSEGLQFIVTDGHLAADLLEVGIERKRLHIGIDPGWEGYPKIRKAYQCARELDVPLVALGSAMTGGGDDRDVARLLGAVRLGEAFDTVPFEALPPPGAILRSEGQLQRDFTDLGEAVRNNRYLCERCSNFRLLPRRPVFPSFTAPSEMSGEVYLRRLCEQGVRGRYGEFTPPVRNRLEKELSLIARKGFSEYFLVVWDIVQYAHRRGAPVAGRGSGASSIVAYLLGITNVCPLEYDIPFERFLNEQRDDFPDLDVDFCWRIRDEVIEYAFDRWGRDRVAMVSMHTTFQPRSAIRETAKALGLSNEQISRMMKEGISAGETYEREDRGGSEKRPVKGFGGLPEAVSGRILELSNRLLDLPHNLSVHPGGIVIAPKPIDRYVPIQRAAKGVWITQYDKDGVEDIALVKLDLLGNRALSTVRYAFDLISRRTGRRMEIQSVPTGDGATIELLRSARTVGCNQLESPAMRHLLKMMRPGETRDIMKILALIRPGAASIGMKEAFIRRHRGLDTDPPAPPAVTEVLAGTHGVMLYEDDVMLTAAAMLRCSLGEADQFRRSIQKCTTDEEGVELSRRFLARCAGNGIDREYAKSMWVQMAKYNAYSFCRAHAASYALLAYAGAYLKTHHPLEFWTSALNNNQSMYHPRVYVEQAKRDGVRFVLPDVNRSGEEFAIDSTPTGEAIRVGLNFVTGLGPVGAEQILRARQKRPFETLSDFLTRVRLSDEEVRSLILCGAFDSLGRSRPGLMMELNLCSKMARIGTPAGTPPALLRTSPVIPDPPGDYTSARKYFDQRRILGITVGEHLMTLYRPLIDGRVDTTSRDVESCKGKRVRIAGLLEARRTTNTRRGEGMMFLTLDDEYGLFEVTLFPGLSRRLARGFTRYGPYVVTGKIEDQYDSLSITAETVEYFDVPETENA